MKVTINLSDFQLMKALAHTPATEEQTSAVKGLCSPRSSWLPLRLFITEASILENSRTICALLLFARTLKTAHPDFSHLVKNQSLTSIFPLVSLDSQYLWIKSSTD